MDVVVSLSVSLVVSTTVIPLSGWCIAFRKVENPDDRVSDVDGDGDGKNSRTKMGPKQRPNSSHGNRNNKGGGEFDGGGGSNRRRNNHSRGRGGGNAGNRDDIQYGLDSLCREGREGKYVL